MEKHKTREISSQIRDFINNSTIKKTKLFAQKEEGYWNQLFSALDTIGDTSIAIGSFNSISESDFKTNQYLNVYGLLQALFLQQDAVSHLKEALFQAPISWKDYPMLNEIRQLRNETVGHPTKRQRKGRKSSYEKDEVSFSAIDRSTISKNGFGYFLYSSFGTDRKKVVFEDILSIQDAELGAELTNILRELKNEERGHKEKFITKLSDLFSENSLYDLSLIYGASDGDSLGWPSFDYYKEIYKKIRMGIEERYGELDKILRIPGTVLVIKKLAHIFDRIESYKNNAEKDNEIDLEIYVDSLKNNMEELKIHLKEIDEEFKKEEK